jgi:hypothetical protein
MVMYEYQFGDGFVMRFYNELPFILLKASIDKHNGLVRCKKIYVVEVECNE